LEINSGQNFRKTTSTREGWKRNQKGQAFQKVLRHQVMVAPATGPEKRVAAAEHNGKELLGAEVSIKQESPKGTNRSQQKKNH